ncbi:MAG: restriction endonuclease subunit S [Proteobacteria bacterium]|nr:restriction endonuclease subunit S [Pseudomonadota bacterium]MBS0602633.1 restriction endonuclease subunit S [Pseudomonadota bacterium]
MKLSELLRERRLRNRDLKYGPSEVLSVSGDYGCVNQIELLGRSYAGVSVKEYHVVETGDLVYTKSPLKRNPYGIIKENKGEPGIVSTLYAVYHATELAHPAYLDHYFSRDYNLNSYLQPIVRKGAKNDMKVNNAAVLSGELLAPTILEQQKIADCLTSLDEVIAAQGRKVEALRTYKRGLMQQLFPREGETLPRLRFPEFRDAPEWATQELGPMTSKVGSGITPLGGDKNYKIEGRPFVRSQNVGWGELLLNDIAHIDEETHCSFDGTEIQESDVLLNITGASIGRSAVADSRIVGGNVNQHVCIIRAKQDELNPVLLNQFLISESGQKQIDSFQAGGNRQGLNFAQIRSFNVPIPPTEYEQQRIANCLASFDTQITVEAEKLDALKAHKQGLMQQLFPSPNEA